VRVVAGISDFCVYIPKYRIKAEEFRRSWGEFLGAGVSEKAVCFPDEDVITMACEACLGIAKRGVVNVDEVKAIFFATTSSHYVEKELASTLATVLGTTRAFTVNLGYSMKSGSSALIAASKYADGGGGKALVVAADAPRSSVFDPVEHEAGCGAAAFVVQGGTEGAIAILEGFASASYEVLGDRFRVDGEKGPRSLNVRAYNVSMLRRLAVDCTKALLSRLNRDIDAYDHIIFTPPIDGGRTPVDIVRNMGGSPDKVTKMAVSNIVGDCGCALPLMCLAHVLENSRPNEKILLISYGYGGGCDALSIVTTERVSEVQCRGFKFKDYLESKEYIDLKTYLRYRELIE
jgi:hydroxymethylglutaryl-CoA synthase